MRHSFLVIFSILTMILSGCVVEDVSGSGTNGSDGSGNGGTDNSSVSYQGCVTGQGLGTNSIQVEYIFPAEATRVRLRRNGIQVAEFSQANAINPYVDDSDLREGATYLYTCEALFDGLWAEGDTTLQLSTLAINAPTSFTGIDTAAAQSANSVLVTWIPTVSDIPVSAYSYQVFANVGDTVDWTQPPRATVLAGSPGQSLIDNLGDDLSYAFGVRACSEGNICETNTVQRVVVTPDGGVPTTVGVTSLAVANGELQITAPWVETNGGIVRRYVYVRTGPTGGLNLGDYTLERTYQLTGADLFSPPTTLSVSPLVEGQTYHVIVQDEDPGGLQAAVTQFQSLTITDITPPSFGGITSLVLGTPQDSVIQVGWTAIETEGVDPINGGDRYQIFSLSDSAPIASNPCTSGTLIQELAVSSFTAGTTATFDMTGLTEKTYYKVCVKAIDLAGNVSINNNSLQVNTLDITAPSFIGVQSISFDNQSSSLNISWNASGSADIKEYQLTLWVNQPTPPGSPTVLVKSHADFPNGGSITSLEFPLADNDQVYVIVEACDLTEAPFGTQNCSSTGVQRDTVVPDVTPPPGFLGISGPTALTTPTEGEIVVAWNAPSDWSDYRGFRVYEVEVGTNNLTLLRTCPCIDYGCSDQITSCSVNGLDAYRTYRLHVRAYDEAQNETLYLDPASSFTDKRTSDTTPPTFASNLVVGASPTFPLSWNAALDNQFASEPGAVINYSIYQNNAPFDFSNPTMPDGNLKTSTQNLNFIDSGFIEAQTYYYTVCASDASGNTTCDQLTRNFTVPDVTDPVISSLTSNKNLKNKVWELSWTASDNISSTANLFIEVRRRISVAGDLATSTDELVYSGLGSTLVVSGDDMSTTQPVNLNPLSGPADLDRFINYLVTVRDEEGNEVSGNVTVQSNNSLSITSVHSANGPIAGGKLLSIKGSGFTKGLENDVGVDSAVTIAGQPCTSVAVLSENNLYCTTPAAAVPGSVEVRVRNQINNPIVPGGEEFSEVALTNGYTYNAVDAICDDPGSWGPTFASGTGTNLDPYIICDATHLDNVRTVSDVGASFQMGDSVDLMGVSFDPLGNATSKFEGNFDGDGHLILNWDYNNPAQANIGIFGYITGDFQISNLGVVNASVVANQSIGGLMGVVEGGVNKTGLISNVFVTGSFDGGDFVGGLIGRKQNNHSNFNVINSYFVGTINVTGITGYGGGIAGFLGSDTGGFFQDVYSEGTVTGTKVLGGLFGNLGENKQLLDSFSRATVTGSGDTVGGLAGEVKPGASISNSVAEGGSVSGVDEIGGLVGLLEGTVSGSNATINVTSSGRRGGGLIGYASAGVIQTSYATGAINVNDSGGGLVGELSDSNVSGSYATGAITASGADIGGLIGRVFVSASVTSDVLENYATGNLDVSSSGCGGLIGTIETLSSGTLNVTEAFSTSRVGDNFALPSQQFGGLIGKINAQSSSTVNISQCYATGEVNVGSFGGGLLGGYDFTGGQVNVDFCFSAAVVNGGASDRGGVFGQSSNTLHNINDTYWDSQVSTQSFASGNGSFTGTVTPHTTAEMQDFANSIYTGWDFSNIWLVPAGTGYPELQFASP